jgi:hypothetical protein
MTVEQSMRSYNARADRGALLTVLLVLALAVATVFLIALLYVLLADPALIPKGTGGIVAYIYVAAIEVLTIISLVGMWLWKKKAAYLWFALWLLGFIDPFTFSPFAHSTATRLEVVRKLMDVSTLLIWLFVLRRKWHLFG